MWYRIDVVISVGRKCLVITNFQRVGVGGDGKTGFFPKLSVLTFLIWAPEGNISFVIVSALNLTVIGSILLNHSRFPIQIKRNIPFKVYYLLMLVYIFGLSQFYSYYFSFYWVFFFVSLISIYTFCQTTLHFTLS